MLDSFFSLIKSENKSSETVIADIKALKHENDELYFDIRCWNGIFVLFENQKDVVK